MSSRQLCSNGDSDGLSLPPTTRKGKGKKSTQPPMEQQQDQLQQQATVQLSPLQNQPPRPASTQPTMGESVAPTTGQTDRSHSTPVPCNELNTQDSGSHMSQMSGPLFTEDRLSTSSSDADVCDTEVLNITQRCTPSEVSTVMMSPRPGCHSTVDYSTQGDPEQQAVLPDQQLNPEQQWIV